MSADFAVHVLTDKFTAEDYKAFASNTLGSAYFDLNFSQAEYEKAYDIDLFCSCSDTPHLYVGEVSWLKASLTGDIDEYVPDLVLHVSELFNGNELLLITDEVIEKVRSIIDSFVEHEHYSSGTEGLLEFFEKYKGSTAFTVSW